MKRWLFIGILILGFFLRFYKLWIVPSSLHEDEVGVGYNAFTLLTTGKDEHGVTRPLTLREDAPPLIFYSDVPAIAIFGLTELAVRLPSATVGVLTLVAFYWLSWELGGLLRRYQPKAPSPSTVALIGMLLLAIVPWHVQLTRIVHGAEYALLLQVLALASFFAFLRQHRSLFLYLSGIFFGLGFYPYHSTRLTSPLLFAFLLWFFRKELRQAKKQTWTAVLCAVLIALPVVMYVLATPLPQTRFGGVNIFIGEKKDLGLLVRFPLKLTTQFLTQLNLRTLFFDSSNTRYFNVRGSGLLNLAGLPFLLYGLWWLRKTRLLHFLLMWFFISLLPGALTLGALNGGRAAGVLPVLTWLMGVGVVVFWKQYQSTVYAFILATVFLLGLFLNNYFNVSPYLFSKAWQYGLKEAVVDVTAQESNYDQIIFDRTLRQAYVYVLYYGHKPLDWVLSGKPVRNPVVGYVAFHSYEFRAVDWNKDLYQPRTLIVVPADKVPADVIPTSQIRDLNGVPVISLVSR